MTGSALSKKKNCSRGRGWINMRDEYVRPWHFGGQTARKRDPQREPSRESWQGCTRGGCRAPPHRPRKRKSWLNSHCKHVSQYARPFSTSYILTGLEDGLLGKCLNEGSLVAGGVDEPVEQDLDVGVLGGQKGDLVGDGLGSGEGGDVLANTGKGELDALGVGTGELGLALLADDDEVGGALLSEESTDATAHTGVSTTAESLVGGANDDEGLLLLGLGGLGLGSFEDLVGGLTVLAGLGHGALGTGELGGGNDLHGVGDLLDVLDGLEAALNFSKRRVASGGAGGSSSNPTDSIMSIKSSLTPPNSNAKRLESCRIDCPPLLLPGGQLFPSRYSPCCKASRQSESPGSTYRVGAATAARRAGRAVRDNILTVEKGRIEPLPTVAQLIPRVGIQLNGGW